MKILLATPFYPPDLGGISYHVQSLSKKMKQFGHEVTVVCPSKGTTGEREVDSIRCLRMKSWYLPPWPYPTLSSVSVSMKFFSDMKNLITKNEWDIIHCHGHHYPITWSALYYANKYQIPSVLTLHGMYALNPYVNGGKTLLEDFLNGTLLKTMIRKAKGIIGLTPAITTYGRKLSSEKCAYATIPNGIELNIYNNNLARKTEFRSRYGIPSDKLVVLFIGRFEYVKGLIELAKAARILSEIRNDLFFVFAGSGSLDSALRKTLENHSNVLILTWQPHERIHELYLASDIFVLPSRWEALPITVIEAMAARLTILTTTAGGIPDILENYPFKAYLNEIEPQAIARMIAYLAHSRSYGVEKKNHVVAETYDWYNICRKTEEFYYAICSRCIQRSPASVLTK